MTIIRVQKDKNNPYFLVNRKTVCDDRLTWKATGILCYLLSLPDDWEIHFAEILPHKTDRRDALRTGFIELIKFGYMTKTPMRNSKGQITDWLYTLYESPQLQDSPETENPFVVNEPFTENPFVGKQPETEKPETENPTSDNPIPLINNNSLNNDLNKIHINNTNTDRQPLFEILKKDFNQDTPIARETINKLADEYGSENTKEAMKRAVIQGVPKISYVIGILKSGINTPKEKKFSAQEKKAPRRTDIANETYDKNDAAAERG